MITDVEIQAKIRKSEQIIREAYYKNSLIERLVNVKVDTDPSQIFLKLGRRFNIPSEWYSRNDIYYDIALNQFGESIARSETNYIINKILENEKIERVKTETIDPTIFKEKIREFSSAFGPTILFAPVEYFVDLSYSWRLLDRDFTRFLINQITILDRSYDVVWSSKYRPFNVFIFANKNYGQWLTKPSLDQRFYVGIGKSEEPRSLELTMYTLFNFSITRPDQLRILEAKSPQPEKLTQ